MPRKAKCLIHCDSVDRKILQNKTYPIIVVKITHMCRKISPVLRVTVQIGYVRHLVLLYSYNFSLMPSLFNRPVNQAQKTANRTDLSRPKPPLSIVSGKSKARSVVRA